MKESMKDVAISSSSRFYDEVRVVRDNLEALGVSVFTPELDLVESRVYVDPAMKQKLTMTFLDKIKTSKVLLVITDEEGYVGRSVSLEVGFAYGLGRPIFCLFPIVEPAIACLCKKVASLDEIVSFLKGID